MIELIVSIYISPETLLCGEIISSWGTRQKSTPLRIQWHQQFLSFEILVFDKNMSSKTKVAIDMFSASKPNRPKNREFVVGVHVIERPVTYIIFNGVKYQYDARIHLLLCKLYSKLILLLP